MRLSRLFLYSLILAPLVWSTAVADIVATKSDGWHTWQVDEPGVSSKMCCFTWNDGEMTENGCHLDGRGLSMTDHGDCAAAAGTVQIYVKFQREKAKDIRVLSSNCPVRSDSKISNHGLVSAAENLAWFRNLIEDRNSTEELREEALFGLVQSGGDAAFEYLDRLLTDR